MKLIFVIFVLCLTGAAWGTDGKRSQVDPKAGAADQSDSARVIISNKLALAPLKGMIVISESAFARSAVDDVTQLKALNFFEQVLVFDDLEKVLVGSSSQGKVFTPVTSGDLKDIYHSYRPFLFVYFESKSVGDADIVHRLIAVDPDTMERVFVSEVEEHSKLKFNAVCVPTSGAGVLPSSFCAGPNRIIRGQLLGSFAKWIRENE
ncbi:MAG: hypothetical protein ACLPXB_09970 [Thiobacillaceae bacterium]